MAADVEATAGGVARRWIEQFRPGVNGEAVVEAVRRIDLHMDIVNMVFQRQRHAMVRGRGGLAAVVADGAVGPTFGRFRRRRYVLRDQVRAAAAGIIFETGA